MTVLKKALRDGQAFTHDHHGENDLFDVLAALAANVGVLLSATVATPTVAVAATQVALKSGFLQKFRASLGTTGTGTDAVIQLKNGSKVLASITVPVTDDDGTIYEEDIAVADQVVDPGDVLTIEVTVISTGIADLDAQAVIQDVQIEN